MSEKMAKSLLSVIAIIPTTYFDLVNLSDSSMYNVINVFNLQQSWLSSKYFMLTASQ